MKLGARIFKTGIAIVLALYLAEWLNLPSPVLAGIAAIFAIQPNIYRSYLTVIEQIQANIIGAVLAILFVLVFGNHIIIVGMAVIIAIILLLKFKLEKSIPIALVTIVAIMEVQNDQFVQFSMIRMFNISIGVLSSFLVNLIFLPPQYETKLFSLINQLNEDVLKWIRITSRNASESYLLKKDIIRQREKLIKIDNMFLLYKEDRTTPLKKNLRAKQRKIVLYRKLILTTRRSMDILQRLNQYENELHHLNPQLLRTMQDHLDCLVSYHEHLLLRFVGKAKTTETSEELFEPCMNRDEFMHMFTDEIYKNNSDEITSSIHLLHIVSSILEYGEKLEHLDHLMTSFYKYHTDDEAPEYEEE
ncbi:aromatic acid exporter family protein [Domibacillus sp. DTU_2020_1001157_1_SI_ALB_TIR_016]|uniref:FUSC family protein n=1 Tax=Domibacillus sp. DTU_2020_1001157_1_SI_ALB_TIR_016 TaxID=3077789 RepID=UPI0028ED38CD|nr:aromatic acid exporter family protein [Domibacillus sp. DTU_2020_1001157_1_SI_ALB_TIR_016]WNS80141.1 aromatic acid exporter family protein [Domibacillus sp. DTU_2020_1001157_1_SI_ALB_TIR_016]